MDDINKQFIPTIQCSIHKFPITKGCSDFNCKKRTLSCIKCMYEDSHNDHSSQNQDLQHFSISFIKQLESISISNRIQCKQFLTSKDNADFFKAMHNHQQHLKKISDNIETQKVAIALDLTNLQEQIMIKCQKVKDTLFQKLDQFNANYIESFKFFQKSFKQSFSLAQDYYYSHTSTFNNKLAQQNEKANDFLSCLKISSNLQQKSLDDLKQITNFAVNIPSHSLFYNQTPEIQILTNQCAEAINIFLLNKLQTPMTNLYKRQQSDTKDQDYNTLIPNKLQKYQSLPLPMKGIQNIITSGGQGIRIGEIFGANQFLSFRPLKKYQLDFPVTCLLALSQQLFALASAIDGKIHMFQRDKKKATLYDAHETQITLLEKLEINRTDIFVNNIYQKKQAFLSVGQDGTIMIWQTNSNNNIEKIRKYQFGNKTIQCAIDFQNGGGFIFIDCEGRLGYINAFTNEESISQKCRVVGRPLKATLVKPNERFITYVVGQESGMMWKMIELEGKKEFQAMLVQTLPSSPCIITLSQFQNYCALVSNSGVTLIDLDQKQFDREARIGTEVETLTFEFLQENLTFLVVIPFGYGFPQQFKIEKLPGSKYDIKAQELKLEVIQNLEISGKPKVRIFKEEDKIFIILSNTIQQELLVYEVLRR